MVNKYDDPVDPETFPNSINPEPTPVGQGYVLDKEATLKLPAPVELGPPVAPSALGTYVKCISSLKSLSYSGFFIEFIIPVGLVVLTTLPDAKERSKAALNFMSSIE